MNNEIIQLAHGSGGKLMQKLIKEFFLEYFNKESQNNSILPDAAVLNLVNKKIAFTTDSYVIDPIFFPGGNIGKLAICGTINDLSVSGAKPLYISVSFIIEEGLPFDDLKKVVLTMAEEAKKAEVKIVTGDTKVVPKGKCDKLFINTTGIGTIFEGYEDINTGKFIESGDKVIINGYIGDHAIAILGARENIRFEMPLESDCNALNKVIQKLIEEKIDIKFMRDVTRGGLATVISEIVENKKYGLYLEEEKIPVRDVVKGICEVFGYDPLYLANEGKFILIVSEKDAEKALNILRNNENSEYSSIIGEITNEYPSKAILKTITGSKRLIEALTGEILPRIC